VNIVNFRRSGGTPPKPRGTVKFANLPSGKSNTPGAVIRSRTPPSLRTFANIRRHWLALRMTLANLCDVQ
jgi:hypothetical protein